MNILSLNFHKNDSFLTHQPTTTNLAQYIQVAEFSQPAQMISRIPLWSILLLNLWIRPQTHRCDTTEWMTTSYVYNATPLYFTLLTIPQSDRRGELKLGKRTNSPNPPQVLKSTPKLQPRYLDSVANAASAGPHLFPHFIKSMETWGKEQTPWVLALWYFLSLKLKPWGKLNSDIGRFKRHQQSGQGANQNNLRARLNKDTPSWIKHCLYGTTSYEPFPYNKTVKSSNHRPETSQLNPAKLLSDVLYTEIPIFPRCSPCKTFGLRHSPSFLKTLTFV